MNLPEKGIFGDVKQPVSMKELAKDYFKFWPLFLISIVLSLLVCLLYIQYAIPKFIANTSFLIIGKEGGNPNSFDLIENALNVKKEVNVNNEMLLIAAQDLMRRTIVKNNFNVNYFKITPFRDVNIYTGAPFLFRANKINDSNRTHNFFISNLSRTGGVVSINEKFEKSSIFTWDKMIAFGGEQFILSNNFNRNNYKDIYRIQWQPVIETADMFSKELSIKSYDSKTSVIQLAIKTDNLNLGKDVLNALFSEFNRADIEERNKLSESTVQFIDNRLLSISNDLNGVEGNLEKYQGSNALVDIKGQSNQSLENSNILTKNIRQLAIQQDVALMITSYFNNPKNDLKLVPSSLGLEDATLQTLINQYNTLQLKRERDAQDVAVNSTVMLDLNGQIASLKTSILESLNNINSNLQLQQNKLSQQNNQYKNFLSALPHNERVLLEIKRRQNITEGLYLYLLQKREEAAISTTSSKLAHYKQIDAATGIGPVEPNSFNLIVYSCLLGFFLAFGIVYLSKFFNDTIGSMQDISKRTALPIMGQIAFIPKYKNQLIAAVALNNIGDQFRSIRTNVSLLLKNKSNKVLLVTSAGRAAGKTFVSINLATILSFPKKKVALVECNFREPFIGKNLQINVNKGLTNFLMGFDASAEGLAYKVESIPGLHLYLCGAVSSNPGDLLLSENMKLLFSFLKANYDYIIIDSPSLETFSDAKILASYADATLCIVRSKKTVKSQIDFISDLAGKGVLPNVAFILNEVNMKFNYAAQQNSTDTILTESIVKDKNLSFAK